MSASFTTGKQWRDNVKCWTPFWAQCDVCSMDYNVIMKLETMTDDEMFLITLSNMKKLKKVRLLTLRLCRRTWCDCDSATLFLAPQCDLRLCDFAAGPGATATLRLYFWPPNSTVTVRAVRPVRRRLTHEHPPRLKAEQLLTTESAAEREWRHLKNNVTSTQAAPDFYQKLTTRQMRDLHQRYKLDFELFGYTLDAYLPLAKDAPNRPHSPDLTSLSNRSNYLLSLDLTTISDRANYLPVPS
ncbi:hypothetical protein GWK47_033199 [Chionoecetes opilio]|uniref:Carbohydrate sulfotransferase n=1 Tax=Chionoecetes opilio TaxID=41210 RepID=A0A8J5D0E7_CHIOP|nr:hypothetical protein GWK47_033199 [Chionoecetes opilio]